MSFDEQRFRDLVIASLGIPAAKFRPDLKMGDIDEWDSVAHLDLISTLEKAFGLRLKLDEIAQMTSLEQLRRYIKESVAS